MPPQRSALKVKTQRRRWQNIVAQRNYRTRQKERLKALESLAVTSLALPASSGTTCTHAPYGLPVPRLHLSGDPLEPSSAPSAPPPPPVLGTVTQAWPPPAAASLTAFEFFSCLHACTDRERRNFMSIMTNEVFGMRDVIKYGLIALGYPVAPSSIQRAGMLPMGEWIQTVHATLGELDFKIVAQAGIEVLSHLEAPTGQMSLKIHNVLMPWTDCIPVSRVSFCSAILKNALLIGIPWSDLLIYHSQSPFPRLGVVSRLSGNEEDFKQDPQMLQKLPSWLTDLPPDLRPTRAQLTIPHHPSYDVIPWPGFRSRAIVAGYSYPPTIDKDDLGLDLLNEGIRCWGLAGDAAAGVPWDSRSWEAAPWFLQKWGHLMDGREGEEWRTSAWWRSMRGGACI